MFYLLLVFEGGFLCFVRTSFGEVVLGGECQALWVLSPLRVHHIGVCWAVIGDRGR